MIFSMQKTYYFVFKISEPIFSAQSSIAQDKISRHKQENTDLVWL